MLNTSRSPHYLQCLQSLKSTNRQQKEDPVCEKVREYCQSSSPKRDASESVLKAYWKVRKSLTLCDNILLYNNCIVVPAALRRQTLSLIHQGHQGVERSLSRTKAAVSWPCVSSEVKQYVESCAKQSQLQKAPLIPTPLPDYPWQQISRDLFKLGGQHYLLVVDYFSRFPEVIKLTSATSASVITMLKSIFSCHGIPEVVRSDNGPQYTSNEFTQFAQEYGFRQVMSSPYYPQSNSAVERMVQTVKGMLKKSSDPHLAVLAYRATSMPWCSLSPSELCMGQRLRTTVQQSKQQLIPTWPSLAQFKSANARLKAEQKENFDIRNRVHKLTKIQDDVDVWVWTDGQAVEG